jgi:hypothetical protein
MIQRAIDKGEIRDQAEAARQMGLTWARMTHLIDLTFLAPDIQREVLCSEGANRSGFMTERRLRRAAVFHAWLEQRSRLPLALGPSPPDHPDAHLLRVSPYP